MNAEGIPQSLSQAFQGCLTMSDVYSASTGAYELEYVAKQNAYLASVPGYSLSCASVLLKKVA